MSEDYYSLLGVDPDASEEAILRAYRQRAVEHHPDVSDDPGAEETFRRLNRAKQVLTDEARRREYDRLGHDRFVDRRGTGGDQSARPAGSRSAAHPGDSPASRPAGVPSLLESLIAAFGDRPGGATTADVGASSVGWTRGTGPSAVDLAAAFRAVGPRGWASRGPAPDGPSPGTEPGRSECPKCRGRGRFVHVIDTARGRTRRLEPCERCDGAGTVRA